MCKINFCFLNFNINDEFCYFLHNFFLQIFKFSIEHKVLKFRLASFKCLKQTKLQLEQYCRYCYVLILCLIQSYIKFRYKYFVKLIGKLKQFY